MGYIRHTAILVTGDRNSAALAQVEASRLMDSHAPVTGLLESPWNGSMSFAVLPDGSKLGWEGAALADAARLKVLDYLAAQAFEDGSSPLQWVIVQYGDEEGDNKAIRASGGLGQ